MVHIESGAKLQVLLISSALSLFVLRVLTDYSDTAFSLDDFALFANWFNR